MDKNAKSLILRHILTFDVDSEHGLDELIPEFPQLQKNEIRAALMDLSREKLIICNLENGTAQCIRPTLKAFGYFREQEEIEENKKFERWEERRWNLFASAVTALICGIALFLLKWFVTGKP